MQSRNESNTKDRRMYERYQKTIRLHLPGSTASQIALILGRTSKTIKAYIDAYNEHGLNGLIMKQSTGKPPRLRKDQQPNSNKRLSITFLMNWALQENWTLEIIASYIRCEFGHIYSIRGVSKLLHRISMNYTKPTYTLASADEEKQRELSKKPFQG